MKAVRYGFAGWLVLAAACAPGGAAAADKIKITTPVESLSASALYVARGQGLFAAEGLEAEIVVTGGTGPDVQALLVGESHFAYTPGTHLIEPVAKGQRLIAVMAGQHRLGINVALHKDVAQAKGITPATPFPQKLKALDGMTLGPTRPGALTWQLAEYLIRRAGYTPQKEVKVIAAGAGPVLLAALEHRKVDAIIMSSPIPETAVQRGHAIMFIDNVRGDDPNLSEFLMMALVTRPDFARERGDIVRRTVQALIRANQWMLARSPEEVRDALRGFLPKVSPDVLLTSLQALRPAISVDGRISEKSFRATQDVMEAGGFLKERIPYEQVVTHAYLPK
jgi:NitT/TauT family transport system substrate-binding protein